MIKSFLKINLYCICLLILSCVRKEVVDLKVVFLDEAEVKSSKRIEITDKITIEELMLDGSGKVSIKTYYDTDAAKVSLIGDLFVSSLEGQAEAYPGFVTRFKICPSLKQLRKIISSKRYEINYVANKDYNSNVCTGEDVIFKSQKVIKYCPKNKKIIEYTYFYKPNSKKINIESYLKCD
ncbi:MAG: hypothetical protein HN576_09975 [Bacteriovoracaceae bacterium]|jgi:hypothetical protein|nr:hypothetical protein [Bacteriovoracaceae bacterium]